MHTQALITHEEAETSIAALKIKRVQEFASQILFFDRREQIRRVIELAQFF